jgi:hypothetical protein
MILSTLVKLVPLVFAVIFTVAALFFWRTWWLYRTPANKLIARVCTALAALSTAQTVVEFTGPSWASWVFLVASIAVVAWFIRHVLGPRPGRPDADEPYDPDAGPYDPTVYRSRNARGDTR